MGGVYILDDIYALLNLPSLVKKVWTMFYANTATILLAATTAAAASSATLREEGEAFLGIKGQQFDIDGLTEEGKDFFQVQATLPSKGMSNDGAVADPVFAED